LVTYDRDRAAEFVLALMHLDLHEGARAWKGYPWDVLNLLHERGLISDPISKAKSVSLTAEGVARATAAFETLLAVSATPPRRKKAAASSSAPASRLSEVQSALVERLLAPICAPHPDLAVSSKLRHGYRVDGYSVVLYESRPAFRAPNEWHEHDVAKFRFVKSAAVWQLFCQFRDLKWHSYEPLPESNDLETLVAEVRRDPTGIFWG
jgi:hypothetical protein